MASAASSPSRHPRRVLTASLARSTLRLAAALALSVTTPIEPATGADRLTFPDTLTIWSYRSRPALVPRIYPSPKATAVVIRNFIRPLWPGTGEFASLAGEDRFVLGAEDATRPKGGTIT